VELQLEAITTTVAETQAHLLPVEALALLVPVEMERQHQRINPFLLLKVGVLAGVMGEHNKLQRPEQEVAIMPLQLTGVRLLLFLAVKPKAGSLEEVILGLMVEHLKVVLAASLLNGSTIERNT
jgi:hypothetical protein